MGTMMRMHAEKPIDDDVAIDDIRRRSWTREQKLGAIKYATSTYVPGKTGSDELIANHAAAFNIGCTPKMLCTWIRSYDEINASPKGSRKNRRNTTPKEPELEEELHKLFVEKRAIGRKINAKWIYRNAQIIYGNRYPHRVVRVEGKQTLFQLVLGEARNGMMGRVYKILLDRALVSAS
jgi:hypothetical protein